MKLRSATIYLLALVIGSLLVSSIEVLAYWRDVEPSSQIVDAWPVIFLVLLVLWVVEDSKTQPGIEKPFEFGSLLPLANTSVQRRGFADRFDVPVLSRFSGPTGGLLGGAMKKSYDSSQSPVVNRRVLLFLLLGFIGGGIGALLALFFGIRNWPDARLIILSGIAIGLALAAALAPNLLTPQDREASAPNR
jgi:uncharacterized membrane protein